MVTIETCVPAVSCSVETLNLCPRTAIQPEEVDSIQIQNFFREIARDFLGAIKGLNSVRWPGFDVKIQEARMFAYFCGDK